MGAYPSGSNGRARVNPRYPTAFGICDRDGFRYNRTDLFWQFEWSGNQLQNRRILVCKRCLDIPNQQLRSYAVPPDPIPLENPRPDYSCEGNYPVVINTQTGGSRQLLPASATRNLVNFVLPPSFGLWINRFGGPATPGSLGAVFYAPGSQFEVWNESAQEAMNYFTTIQGLQIVVQTQDCEAPEMPVPPWPGPTPSPVPGDTFTFIPFLWGF